MRDLALILLFSALALVIARRAWTGVLALAAIAYLHPQGYADGLMQQFPAYQVFFLLTLASLIHEKQWLKPEWRKQQLNWILDWRFILILLLWLQTGISSLNAIVPVMVHDKWTEFSLMLLGLLLTPLLIDTPRKLFLLSITIGLSFSLVALKGGFWAMLHGAADRVYGPPESHFYDNNHFAIAALMTLPLLLLWIEQTGSRKHRYMILLLALFSLVATLSSWSRGALLALTASSLFLLITHQKKNRLLTFTVLLAIGVGSVTLMPDDWLQRMGNITHYENDGSAQGRLDAWQQGITQGMRLPLTGWGFDSWRIITIGRDWHSAYVESFVEHGLPGFVIWVLLLFGSLIHLQITARQSIKQPQSQWKQNTSRYYQTSLIAYAVGALFLGITYWDLFYHLVFLGLILDKINSPEHSPAAARQEI